jgi:AraC family transcriptional regulator, regulatory protein of adaptative response / DNA-3-methyladenine glycosylase II
LDLIEIAYKPPYDWRTMMSFLESHAVAGVEVVDRRHNRYSRTLLVDGAAGWFSVADDPPSSRLLLSISPTLANQSTAIAALVRRAFDTEADPVAIAAHLGPLAAANPGLRLPGVFDGFELAVRTILGQQVTVRAGTTMATRLARKFGEPFYVQSSEFGLDLDLGLGLGISSDFDLSLELLTPTAERLAAASLEDFTSLGIIQSRARAIMALAAAVAERRLSLAPDSDAELLAAQLKSLPGIGEWTAQFVTMRLLALADSFPSRDLVIKKAAGESNEKVLLALAEKWRPWRSYAAMHLWKSAAKSLNRTD